MTRRGPKVAVVGNCQGAGIAVALRRLVPGSEVDHWNPSAAAPEEVGELIDSLRQFDRVIAVTRNGKVAKVPLTPGFREALPLLVEAPTVVFRGFQPDCIPLRTESGLLNGPFGQFHSGIIATGYALGLPQERLPRLFNTLVFAAFGFFASFEIAKQDLIGSFDAAGYDVRPHLEAWFARETPFMFTVNHPSIEVLARVATLAAERAGLVAAGTPAPDGVEDFLAGGVHWPFYPELARRQGRSGSLTFLGTSDGAMTIEQRSLAISDVVEQSFREYDRWPPGTIAEAVPEDMREGLQRLLSAS